MVSPHLGKFSQEDVADGRGVDEVDILLQEKFQQHLNKNFNRHNGNAHILKSHPKSTEAERRQAAYLYANWIDCANMRG